MKMNKKWSELNKTMQIQIKKQDTYKMGIDTLLNLRSQDLGLCTRNPVCVYRTRYIHN